MKATSIIAATTLLLAANIATAREPVTFTLYEGTHCEGPSRDAVLRDIENAGMFDGISSFEIRNFSRNPIELKLFASCEAGVPDTEGTKATINIASGMEVRRCVPSFDEDFDEGPLMVTFDQVDSWTGGMGMYLNGNVACAVWVR